VKEQQVFENLLQNSRPLLKRMFKLLFTLKKEQRYKVVVLNRTSTKNEKGCFSYCLP
jgi:hypothetical protein